MNLEGQQLGEFEILERLGQGGMGAVYKARQISLGRLVALKTLQAGLADNADYIIRFQQEARAAAVLNHPNLVQVISAGETEGLHWFAMEYVEGESAKTKLKRKGRLDPLEAIAITLHVATALEYGWRKAHLIHRDIKPDNIFLSSDGEVKLGDLGLAKSADQDQGLTTTGHSMGTPHYISPEQVQNMKDVDLRADIYSLGCTLYHMLSGQLPFDGNSTFSIMMKHVNGPVPDLRAAWPECPQAVNDVVGRMMQTDPSRRQHDYVEVIRDLRHAHEVVSNPPVMEIVVPTPKPVAQAKPVVVAKPRVATPQSSHAKKSKLTIRAGIGVGVLVIAVVAFLLFKPTPQGQAIGGINAVSLATTTKDSPFVNGLGMKFVPVPIVGGPMNGQRVLFSIWDTRVQDYEQFVKDTKREWPKPDFEQGPTHPAVAVSWIDASAFCAWLTEREHRSGKLPTDESYRLPTDHEWSCALGIGDREDASKPPTEKSGKIDDVFPWGTQWPPPKGAGNYDPLLEVDTFEQTSPVGSFAANRFGLYDMGGNVWQWCEDWFDKDQKIRVLRGACCGSSKRSSLLSSHRHHDTAGAHNTGIGFRCVLELPAK